MSVFLDIFITLTLFAQGSFFKEVIMRHDFHSMQNVFIFSSGFLIFWVAVKINEYIVYRKNAQCIYYNLLEFMMFKVAGIHNNLFRIFIILQIAVYILFVLNVLWFLKRKKNTIFLIMD